MARTHSRTSSPAPDSANVKRLKTAHPPKHADAGADPALHFAADVLDSENVRRLRAEYRTSAPWRHAVVERLVQDALLRRVKDECLGELSFTEKETDIYKVNQTGDLASLSFLAPADAARLPALLALRDALYSPAFLRFLRGVTGCGALSPTKRDMSVNSYTRGGHLLTHDDVIGSRRVSYILYMPLPHYHLWQREFGGALELYAPGADGEPGVAPEKVIPPSWNQFVFFEVQPGRSFHSVEEVVVGGDEEDGRARLSISGWFHAAQEGEEGYEPDAPAPESKSSREQLTSSSTSFTPYTPTPDPPLPSTPLSAQHTAFLSAYLNPVYLKPRTLHALAARFADESSLELRVFLAEPLAAALDAGLKDADARDGLGAERGGCVPPHDAGVAPHNDTWTVRGPPHKWRYCTLAATPSRAHAPAPDAAAEDVLRALQDELFPSPAFRAWLALVSSLLPLSHAAAARRFRPGLDYTLATSEAGEARLDVVLGLTPDVEGAVGGRGKGKGREEVYGWGTGEWGGWECYMAPHEEEDDPAVYRSGPRKTKGKDKDKAKESNGHSNGGNGTPPDAHSDADANAPSDDEGDAEDDEDGTLLTVQPKFNSLLLVLRDEGVMRFVKYVSAAAEGSRWDVCGEYEVGMVEEEDDEEEDGEGEGEGEES